MAGQPALSIVHNRSSRELGRRVQLNCETCAKKSWMPEVFFRKVNGYVFQLESMTLSNQRSTDLDCYHRFRYKYTVPKSHHFEYISITREMRGVFTYFWVIEKALSELLQVIGDNYKNQGDDSISVPLDTPGTSSKE